MNAKQYLKQLRILDVQIAQYESEKIYLEDKLTDMSMALKEIIVVSSRPMDPIGDTAAKIVDLENQINDKVCHLIGLRNVIVQQIQAMADPLQMKILYKRYVEYKSWETIEKEMNYSYQHLQRLHKRSLKAFENKYEIK